MAIPARQIGQPSSTKAKLLWNISKQLENLIHVMYNKSNGNQDGNYLTSFVDDFRARVLNDGGTFEAYSCLYNSIRGNLSYGGYLTHKFQSRVSLDGGQFEANGCLVNFINSLN
jgi:hypothetical protein